mmetsp:Transcript_163697/g.520204  ORF Transcript_163697/g.520204 Transcript_163697/m.520204 type:complete len:247 (+) Transcript_163697:455-1195(+)
MCRFGWIGGGPPAPGLFAGRCALLARALGAVLPRHGPGFVGAPAHRTRGGSGAKSGHLADDPHGLGRHALRRGRGVPRPLELARVPVAGLQDHVGVRHARGRAEASRDSGSGCGDRFPVSALLVHRVHRGSAGVDPEPGRPLELRRQLLLRSPRGVRRTAHLERDYGGQRQDLWRSQTHDQSGLQRWRRRDGLVGDAVQWCHHHRGAPGRAEDRTLHGTRACLPRVRSRTRMASCSGSTRRKMQRW